MTGELGYSLPPAIRRIARNFHLLGWIGLWVQAVVGALSAIMFFIFVMEESNNSVKAGASLFLAPALIAVCVGVFWSFRYVLFSKKLSNRNPDLRPKPKDAVRAVRIGLAIALVGQALAIMGGESVVAPLLFKGLNQRGVTLSPTGGFTSGFISAGDILPLFAAINTMFTHFIGLCASLWLQYVVDRQ